MGECGAQKKTGGIIFLKIEIDLRAFEERLTTPTSLSQTSTLSPRLVYFLVLGVVGVQDGVWGCGGGRGCGKWGCLQNQLSATPYLETCDSCCLDSAKWLFSERVQDVRFGMGWMIGGGRGVMLGDGL